MERAVNKSEKKLSIISIIKGALGSIVVSLIGILIFAFIIKFTGLSENLIKPINQIIKALSIFFGVMLTLKKDNSNGLIKGLLIGIVYTLLAFVLFSILNGNVSFDGTLINDIIFGGIMGAICGIILVNINKKTK